MMKSKSIKETVLDVGCGKVAKGDVNIDLLVPNDAAYDSSVINTKEIKNLIKSDAQLLPIKDKSFDIVNCTHLLEHLDYPEKAIKEMMRIAKKQVIIKVPTSYFAKVMYVSPARKRWERKHHKRHYTKKSITQFLHKESGTKNWKVRYVLIDFFGMLRRKVSYDIIIPFPIPYEIRCTLKCDEA